ncbi:MAG: hypothetical protein ABI867_23655 [Kofleriaceae bacterium]
MRSLLPFTLLALGCQSSASAPAPARRVIEVREADGTISARIVPGHPCRAVVDSRELLVGGRPLVAQLGATRWTGQDLANGTTLSQNDSPVARIHAKQLFDAEGLPILRVMDNGDIVDPTGRVARKATFEGTTVAIGDKKITGLTGSTDDLALAAMLTAPGVGAEIRALAACHYLLPETKL